MGSIFWLLGPLAGIVFVVFGYGFLGVISSDQCSWADYLFWSIMGLGTLPAVVHLAWLQIQTFRRWSERHLRSRRHPRFQPALHM